MSKGDTRRKSQVSDTEFTNNWNTIFKGSDMPSHLLQKFTAYCNEINSIRHKYNMPSKVFTRNDQLRFIEHNKLAKTSQT